MKVGYLGPVGSFSYTAAQTAFSNEEKYELLPYSTIPACIKALEIGEVDLSVVPIENSIEGSVNTTVDYLFHKVSLKVSSEIVLPIAQQFMVSKENLTETIERIYSHPQALAQSRMFIDTHFPEAEIEVTPSTAYAANYVAEHPEEPYAAIAPKLAAETYALEIISENIQDLELNNTRFWVLGTQAYKINLPSVEEKMTIAITMPNNTPGVLHKALSVFAWRNINLSKIESRPLKTILGEYFFLVDIQVEQEMKLIKNALEEISLMGGMVKVFGNYSIYEIKDL
ncbi:MAG: prephenate dehydratase [Lactobacillales bacterium]|jgi:prephenate dehydratase|nr:prephenate dehydratase [Lactobacillales bacterium]